MNKYWEGIKKAYGEKPSKNKSQKQIEEEEKEEKKEWDEEYAKPFYSVQEGKNNISVNLDYWPEHLSEPEEGDEKEEIYIEIHTLSGNQINI